MIRFFKYTKKEFLKRMMKFGELRIGTLYEYRHYDDEETKDESEGKSTAVDYIDSITATCPEELSESMKGIVSWEEGYNTPVTFTRHTNILSIEVPNAYIYCLTVLPSRAVMRHFGYDTCFEISDIDYFLCAVGNRLSNKELLCPKDDFCLRNNCLYEGRHVDFKHRELRIPGEGGETIIVDKTYWLKDPRFTHQAEHRLVYFSRVQDDSLKPIILKVPEITRVIRPYYF
jgi:hypothetical protein